MKVLVIEDEHRIAGYIKKGLEMKAYAVDVAYDGEEGFDLASSEEYDVIILDRMLPKMDGMVICKSLRENKNHTPILMLTARTEVEDRVEGLECGADDYLGKPFAFVELLARIKALTRRPKNQAGNVLSVGNLSLDTNSYEVTRAGKRVELSRKEFSLLEFLMRHKGQILTAEQLLEQVWSYESDVLPNTAQVYIGYLRNKIDRAFVKEEPLVKTMRGFGYRLGENN